MRKLLQYLVGLAFLWAGPALAQNMLGGFGPPVPSVGAEGGYYLDGSTGNYYGPKTTGTWPGPTLSVPLYTKMTISSAQILAGVPITVVPAPGPGKFIQFLSGFARYRFATAGYTSTQNSLFYYASDVSAVDVLGIVGTGTVNLAADHWWVVLPIAKDDNVSVVDYTNTALVFKPNQITGSGTGTLTIYVHYAILDASQ